MSGSDQIRVRGLADLNRALAKADKQVRVGVRKELRQAVEPVRRDAQSLAVSEIPTIGGAWSRMRVGVTRDLVYVAPRQRGVKTGPRKRPNLAELLLGRAMVPALDRNADDVEERIDDMLGRVARDFNRG